MEEAREKLKRSVWWHFWHSVYVRDLLFMVTAFIGLTLVALFLWYAGLAVIPITVHIEFVIPLTFILFVFGVIAYGLFWVAALIWSSKWLAMTRIHLEESEKREEAIYTCEDVWVIADGEIVDHLPKQRIKPIGESDGVIVRDGRGVKKLDGKWVYATATCGDVMHELVKDDYRLIRERLAHIRETDERKDGCE